MTDWTQDPTLDPALESWVEGAMGHPDFPVQNLPLGVMAIGDGEPRIVVAIGDHALDLGGLADDGLLGGIGGPEIGFALSLPVLNLLFEEGPDVLRALRRRLSELLTDRAHEAAVRPHLHPRDDARMQLPCDVGDYTDFYVGIHHATNIGRQFRPDNPLLPNYKYVPIGYHGRASSVVVSGEPVRRPSGQRKAPDADAPRFGPSQRLDYELELALWVGRGNALGEPIPIGEAPRHIAGYGLLNDWSARDLQGWEYQPLGPFLAKNFLTTVSPWVISPDALAPFRTALMARPQGDPAPLDYLADAGDQANGGLAIALEATLSTAAMRAAGAEPYRLSRGEAAAAMYWSAAQIVTHHASNGCNLQPGDLIGTGTLSTADPDGLGSLMEISKGGKAPLELPGGERRSFLEAGDEIVLSARCSAPGAVSIGFGRCLGRVLD